jgi:branched-subunit amino acid transport protein
VIDSTYFWQIIIPLAVGTLAIRASIILISGKVTISDRVKEIFSYIPAAILPALLAPMTFFHSGQVAWLHGKERLFILILTLGVSSAIKNMFGTIAFGLIALYLVTQIQ